MSLIELKKDPTEKDLAWFGVVMLAFFGIVGTFAWRWSGTHIAVYAIWSAAILLVTVYYAVPRLRRPLFVGWMYASYPIGWVVSHVLLALIYYGVLTPTGLLLRVLGRDSMNRQFDRAAKSYWIERERRGDVSRYFRQF